MKTKKAKAIILRGLPGSGKSYLAEQYYQPYQGQFLREQVIHSTDSYFYRQGRYCFDPALLPENHARNLAAFIQALAENLPLVICDNTNICHWEFLAYQTAAEALGYEVSIETVGSPKDPQHQQTCYERNQHGLTLQTIRQMGKAFQA